MNYFVYQYDTDKNREVYLDLMMKPSAELIKKHWSDFKLVAVVKNATTFGHVFEIGNIGPEENIARLAPMRSVSVGDVIMHENGIAKFVDKYGFGLIKEL